MPCSSDTIRMTPVASQCHRVPTKDMANLSELCPTCHAAIGKHLTNCEDTEWHHLAGHIKLFMLLGSDDKVQRSIDRFGNAIAQDKVDRGLSLHLKRYETICWFPDVEVIPTGVLLSDEFYDMIARGVLWKDVGATLNHGQMRRHDRPESRPAMTPRRPVATFTRWAQPFFTRLTM